MFLKTDILAVCSVLSMSFFLQHDVRADCHDVTLQCKSWWNHKTTPVSINSCDLHFLEPALEKCAKELGCHNLHDIGKGTYPFGGTCAEGYLSILLHRGN